MDIAGKITPRYFTPYRFNPLTDFDAVWFICSRILSVIARCVTYDHRLFLNTNMADKPEAIEFNITHYVCRTYLARQTIWLRSSKSIKRRLYQPTYKEHNQWIPEIGRHRKYKMTVAKPEAVISHVVQQMDTRFQRLYPGFWGCPTRWYHCRHPLSSTDT